MAYERVGQHGFEVVSNERAAEGIWRLLMRTGVAV